MINIALVARRSISCLLLAFERLFFHGKGSGDAVLLIRLDAIGDFVLWLDSAKVYREIYPERKIVLLGNCAWSGLAEGLDYWDEVWPVDTVRLSTDLPYRWRLLRRVACADFGVAIQPTFSRLFFQGDCVVRATGAAVRIGSSGDLSNITDNKKAIGDRWYTRLIPATSQPLMELERNGEFISGLSGSGHAASLPRLPVVAKLPEALRREGNYFIVFPGASWHGRQWPAARFAAVLDQLHQEHGWRPVLCGTAAESSLCASVAALAVTPCINLAGQTTLAEFVEAVRGACLLIGNETSATHIAAAVGTPCVCILGGGHYGRFMPYPDHVEGCKPLAAVHQMACFNCNWQCNQPHDAAGPVPCIAAVSVEQVLENARLAIDLSPVPRRNGSCATGAG